MKPPVKAERDVATSISRIRMPAIPSSTPTRSRRRSGERLSQNEVADLFCAAFRAEWPFAAGLRLLLEDGEVLKMDMRVKKAVAARMPPGRRLVDRPVLDDHAAEFDPFSIIVQMVCLPLRYNCCAL